MQGTIEIPGFPSRSAEKGLPWEGGEGVPRAYLRQLHGHAILRDLVHAFRRSHHREYLDHALSIVDDWIRSNPREQPANRMAWHDETTAMRTQSWLLLREAVRGADRRAAFPFDAALAGHAALLASDSFHTTGTNHGMFQDEALLTYACLVPEDENSGAYFDLATRRLLEYFDLMVTPDGVHREHSPAYHNLIAAKISRMARFYASARENETAARLVVLRRRMARYATHVIKPDGEFPLVSDTFESAHPKPKLFQDEEYRWAASRGRRGRRPTETNVVFPDGGYAIFRSSWTRDGSGTYVHFTAAYHSDYHKHSDDLSVWLYHAGDLLTEAGPNGYDYDDPYTAYGYSAHAHNTLLIDGESLPRVDEQSHAVGITDWDVDTETPWATGRNGRFEDSVHTRTVRFEPRENRVVVQDAIESASEHRFTFLWNCAPGVEPEIADGSVILWRDGQEAASMSFDSPQSGDVRRVRGDIEAQRGFRLGGGEPVPVWVLEIDVDPTTSCTMTHVIQLR